MAGDETLRLAPGREAPVNERSPQWIVAGALNDEKSR